MVEGNKYQERAGIQTKGSALRIAEAHFQKRGVFLFLCARHTHHNTACVSS